MSKKLLCLFFCLIPFLSYSGYPTQENSQIGRYQLVGVAPHESYTSIQLYLLDTTTGYVWKSVKRNSSWNTNHDTWELLITNFDY